MIFRLISWTIAIGIIFLVLSKYHFVDAATIQVVINFLSAGGVVGALFWSIHVTQKNHEFEEPMFTIYPEGIWNSKVQQTLFKIINAGKLPALDVKISISSDKNFAAHNQCYTDYADVILSWSTSPEVWPTTIRTDKFIQYELRRPYRKPINISNCISHDSSDDFFKSYVRIEYKSTYNRSTKTKYFTLFFEKSTSDDNSDRFLFINHTEGLI